MITFSSEKEQYQFIDWFEPICRKKYGEEETLYRLWLYRMKLQSPYNPNDPLQAIAIQLLQAFRKTHDNSSTVAIYQSPETA